MQKESIIDAVQTLYKRKHGHGQCALRITRYALRTTHYVPMETRRYSYLIIKLLCLVEYI